MCIVFLHILFIYSGPKNIACQLFRNVVPVPHYTQNDHYCKKKLRVVCFFLGLYSSDNLPISVTLQLCCRLQLKCDGTRWRTGGEMKGKLADGLGSQYPSHYLGTRCIQHYYRWCRTPRLPAVDWTDAPTGRFKWTRQFRAKGEIWFLRVCRHISTGLYLGNIATPWPSEEWGWSSRVEGEVLIEISVCV